MKILFRLVAVLLLAMTGAAQAGVLVNATRPIQSETTAYAAAVVSNGGTVSPSQFAAINQFYADMKAAGILAKTADMGVLGTGNALQARTSLVLHRLATLGGSPAFVANTGYTFNGSTWLDTLFNLLSDAGPASATAQQLSVFKQGNTASTTTAIGARSANEHSVYVIPRSGGNIALGALDSSIVTGPSTTDGFGLTSFKREAGPVYTASQRGASIGTGTAVTSSSALPNLTLFVGALNDGGVAGNGCSCTISYWWYGAPLSEQQERHHSALVQARLDQNGNFVSYASSVAYGGFGIGSDADDCSVAAPCLTLDRAVQNTQTTGRVWLNGSTAAPPNYQSASAAFTVSRGLRISAIEPLGAKISATGTGSPAWSVSMEPANGATVTFDDLIIDATGAEACIKYQATTTLYRFVTNGVKCQGWTLIGHWANASNIRASLVFNNPLDVGDTMRSWLEMPHWIEGGLSINGGMVTLTNQNTSGAGVAFAWADAAGVTFSVTGFGYDMTTSLTSAGVVNGLAFWNMTGVIDGGTHVMRAPSGSRQCVGDQISTAGNSRTEFDVSGSGIRNVVSYNYCNGGALRQLGLEGSAISSTRALQQNMFLEDNVGHATDASATAGLHCDFAHSTKNAFIRRNANDNCSLAVVDKLNDTLTVDLNVLQNGKSAGILGKGTTNSIWSNNTITAIAGYAGQIMYAEDNSPGDGTHSTGIAANDNTFVVAGASNVIVLSVDPSNTLTPARGIYRLTGGTINSQAWRWPDASTYANCPAWRTAHEASATCDGL